MKSLSYRITLLEDTVINQHSATAGNHQCLDYLPGSAFLGACAGRLYRKLSEDDLAWDAFHSGKVRFCNGLPLDEQEKPGFPIPYALHEPKYHLPGEDKSQLHNLSLKSWDLERRQPKQKREGFVTTAGKLLEPRRSFRLKTAIDREQGYRAREGQLFGYQYLVAGSRWYLQIDLDEGLPVAIAEALDCCLRKEPLRIGRSRAAEFGSIRVEEMNLVTAPQPKSLGNRLLVYCQSDLALRDPRTGALSCRPTADSIGLDKDGIDLGEVNLNVEQSYLRFRNYAPFNSHRGANDLERQVIEAGSVIAFDLKQELTTDQLKKLALFTKGVGEYKQDGLGQILFNPSFLADPVIRIKKESEDSSAVPPKPTVEAPLKDRPSLLLVQWLTQLENEQTLSSEAIENARIWLSEIPQVKQGPTCSQWRQLMSRAESCSSKDELIIKLFDEKEGLCSHGVAAKLWQTEYRFGTSYAKTIKDLLDDQANAFSGKETLLCLGLAHLGRLAASRLRQGGSES